MHTPGPWTFVDHSWCDKSVYSSLHQVDEKRIAAFHLSEDADENEQAAEIANARLVAAAPELLAALKALLCWDNGKPEYDEARAAIEKATK